MSDTAKNSFYFSASNYIKAFLNFIKSFVLAKLLGPTLMGEVAAVSLIMNYGVNLHLGTFSAMNREVPYLRGKGENELAEEYKNTAFIFTIFLSLVAFVVLSIVAFSSDFKPIYRFGFYCLGLALPLYFIYNFKISLLRFKYEFKKVAIYQTIEALTLLVVSVSFIQILSNKAAILGIVTSFLVADIILFLKKTEGFKISFNLILFTKLLKLGVPLIAMGFFYEIFITIDRIMIIKFLDITRLGLYTLPVGMASFYFLGGSAVSSVLYQKMLTEYGQTGEEKVIYKLLTKGTLIVALVSPIIGFAIEGGVFFLIDNFLPEYIESKSIISILIPPSIFMAISPMYSSILVVIGKHMKVIYSQLILVFISVILNYFFLVQLKLNIDGVSYATGICYFFYWLLLTLYAQPLKKNMPVFFIKTFFPLVIIFIIVILINLAAGFIPNYNGYLNYNLYGIFYLIFTIPIYGLLAFSFYLLNKKMKFIET